MNDLFRAAPHVRAQRGRILVVKLGGACLARPRRRQHLLQQLAVVHAFGARLVLVHGGGPQVDELLRRHGEEPRRVAGRRVTTPLGLRCLLQAVAGELNATLAAGLTAAGAPAVGLGAAAGSAIALARRRPPVEILGEEVDFGEVGDLLRVDPAPLRSLLDAGLVPVLCPPAADADRPGGLLNVNADLLAAALAGALGAAKLILVTDAPGILRDPGAAGSVVSALCLAELRELAARGALRGGMAVKAAAIEAALTGGVERVHVVSGLEEEALLRELYTNAGAGTLVTLEPEAAPALSPPLEEAPA